MTYLKLNSLYLQSQTYECQLLMFGTDVFLIIVLIFSDGL